MEQTKFLTTAELEQKRGIKAQHAVFRALKQVLAEAKTGWDVEETGVGSEQDRDGIDIWLRNTATGASYILDISFRRKDDSVFAVLIRHDWFKDEEDGSLSLRKECIGSLVRAVCASRVDRCVDARARRQRPAHRVVGPGAPPARGCLDHRCPDRCCIEVG